MDSFAALCFHLKENLVFCKWTNIVFAVVGCAMFGTTALGQSVSVVSLTGSTDHAVAPLHDGVSFTGTADGEAMYLVTIAGLESSTALVTIGSHFAITESPDDAGFVLSNAVIMERDGEYSFSFVPIPVELKGTEFESQYANAWMGTNSTWFASRFGWGWQESLGEFLAENVLIPLVGVDNLANASDATLVTGTVIVSIPIAVGIVAGGEVVLGVGTIGGGAATTGGAAAGGGAVAGAAGGGGAVVTGVGMMQNAIMRAFFTGQTLANNPTNVAALYWYLQVARDVLARYEAMGYTGPGIATKRSESA